MNFNLLDSENHVLIHAVTNIEIFILTSDGSNYIINNKATKKNT